ncbi:GntR family transcriptional regulator [Thioclava sp. JM3]|uniref:GntR family transcriptional regulator n=1 Tax=Thioclava nitratireducens TaxID=1915078 RepID=A0ABM6IPB3_9RHOB|nr:MULTISPECIES: GntR family transcriptional regulator [Thioclava]AQS50185.1 GntR family transcriptional regulator [Thioclava nitratireducens]OWY12437.1 GntR family transcriptional regulator [Thioclava sp. JM3]PWE48969.1 GntR family transcriptional regulator [Thioclava sp. NG1]
MSRVPSERKVSQVKRGSGVAHVYEMLRNEIIDLKLAPGSPIDETELSERFSMSRTPIREALVRLAAEGLITTLTNRTTIVSNIDFVQLGAFFDALTLMYRVTARLAAQHYGEADLAAIREHQASFSAAVESGDVLGMIATNRDFHVAIAEAGRNKYYTDLFRRLLDDGRRILRLYYRSYDDNLPRQYVIEHERIISAMIARDVEESDRLASEHADQIVHQIRSYISADSRSASSISL